MKLILKEYLASLKERGELDIILPDLLSQMGLNVFIEPSRGFKEYGVDVAAVGCLDGGVEKVYLFSVKEKNLTRSTWKGDSEQSLRWSLDEIQDSFIESRMPPEHKSKPVVICLCFGGHISTGVRQDVSGYIRRQSRESLSFEEWNGDKLADLILTHMFTEALLPFGWQPILHKSLVLIDKPIESKEYFSLLLQFIFDKDETSLDTINKIRQVNLALWLLFSRCRDEKNLEAAYLSAEYTLILLWRSVKSDLKQKNIQRIFESLLKTYHTISGAYLEKSIFPFVDKKHAISQLVSAPCSISINLKLFDILGRLAIKGQWLLHELSERYKQDENQEYLELEESLRKIKWAIRELVINNPLVLSPYKDEQAIDLAMALHLLYQDSRDDGFAESWLDALVERVTFSYVTNGMYPTNLYTYEQLLDHRNKEKQDSSYKESVTKASILYPVLTVFCELYGREEAAIRLEDFSKEDLKHCTLQYWYPNEASEEYLFSGADQHGVATTDFPINGKAALEHVEEESQYSNFFWELSAVKQGYLPLVLMACRHYRYPVPFNLLFPERSKTNNREVDNT
ncbi:MAG: hypothetical protein KJ609_17050 [Gammaproteobacteria bacterium]|nr:hypothetical protein [Gammaproteobacteria bacterium]MBU1468014.1 hypothetical protein [Gammaproteobacteria bacterium]MBU2024149.1 hypothetical protein [Gammaproteobacteria bacterium]MBU2237343.1 hypothetical protein [Gammaproteobacteria bacterium]MBU2320262.1 hypothetical protein [Gammaproteobacteria bacterium]